MVSIVYHRKDEEDISNAYFVQRHSNNGAWVLHMGPYGRDKSGPYGGRRKRGPYMRPLRLRRVLLALCTDRGYTSISVGKLMRWRSPAQKSNFIISATAYNMCCNVASR